MTGVLILCELLGPDPFRHYRNETLPFMLGLCRESSRPAVWKTFGAKIGGGASERFFVDLEEPARRSLRDIIETLGPELVIFNESLDTDLSCYLSGAFPKVEFKSIGDLPVDQQEALKKGTVRRLAAFLNLDLELLPNLDPDGRVLDEIEPCYSREPVLSTHLPALIFLRVLLGVECAHKRPLSANSFYADTDLSSASHDRGCSFCEGGGSDMHSWKLSSAPLDLAFRQIESAVRDIQGNQSLQELHSLEDGKLMFLIQGAVAFIQLESFLDRLLESRLPPAAFLFSCRADDLLAKAAVLERALPRLESLGHAIHIWVIGIENFSESENERFNKCISPEQILRAQEMITRFEKKHPDAFDFSRYGGFSFVLFTPWTTSADLRTNLSWARRVGISPRSFFLRSRVQLIEGRPISILAERDGLVVDRFSEPYFDSGCIQSHHDQEKSWRFRNPEVASIYRLASRLSPETRDMEGDALYEKMQIDLEPHFARGFDTFMVFEALLDAASEDAAFVDEESLFERTLARLEDSPSPRPPVLELLRSSSEGLREAASRLADALEAGDGLLLGHELLAVSEQHCEDGARELRLELRGAGSDRILISIEPCVPNRRYLATGRDFGVVYPSSTPLDSHLRRLLAAIGNAIENRRF